MYYSVDGSNWIEGEGTKLPTRGNAVAYGNGRWVAAGGDSNAYGASNVVAVTSTDGQTWESLNLFSIYGLFGNVPVMNTVFYGNNTWLLGSEYDISIGETILYSSDGVTWRIPESRVAQDLGTYGFAYGTTPTFTEGIFYAVGVASIMGGPLIRSVDGSEWEYENPTGFFETNEAYGILFASPTWFVVGVPSPGKNTSILYSENARAWSNCSFADADFLTAYAIAYNGSNLWVAGGTTSNDYAAANTLKYSGDGITWSNASNDFLYHAYSVDYNSLLNIWLATGTSGDTNSVLYSEDGSNWSFNPASPLFVVGRGIASSSLGDPSVIGIRNYYDRLEFLRNPGPGTTTRVGTPFISYTSTLLNVNNALQFNTSYFFDLFSFKGVLIDTNPFSSSFSQLEDTTISQTLSTNAIVAEQAFTLGAQFI
jgi:hypothetical protein